MCWGLSATAVMVPGGLVATAVTVRQRRPAAIPATIAYFTLMEALQIVGYLTVDQCGLPVNQSIAFLSIIHIIFQPFFINVFAMELLPVKLRLRVRSIVYGVWFIGFDHAAPTLPLRLGRRVPSGQHALWTGSLHGFR